MELFTSNIIFVSVQICPLDEYISYISMLSVHSYRNIEAQFILTFSESFFIRLSYMLISVFGSNFSKLLQGFPFTPLLIILSYLSLWGSRSSTHIFDCRYRWNNHDDVIKWKCFPRCWPFVWGNHRSPMNSPHKGQWDGVLIFSLISTWITGKQKRRRWFETP